MFYSRQGPAPSTLSSTSVERPSVPQTIEKGRDEARQSKVKLLYI